MRRHGGGAVRFPGAKFLRAAAIVLVSTRCHHALPGPPRGAHQRSDYDVASYPPPAVRPEEVPLQPDPDAVWIDGEWAWEGGAWRWVHGRWVHVPAGATFAPWQLSRTDDGALHTARGLWRSSDGAVAPDPTIVAPALPPP
jgi:hypothetical protein